MEGFPNIAFVKTLNSVSAQQDNNLIYGFIPVVGGQKGDAQRAFSSSLQNISSLLDSGQSVLSGLRGEVSKASSAYLLLSKEKDHLFSLLSDCMGVLSLKGGKITLSKQEAGLAILGSVYWNTFFLPAQFFLPDSSLCSGHWKFWESINYQSLLERAQGKDFHLKLGRAILQKKFQADFKPEDFPEIVSMRLKKEKLFGKPLDILGLLKGMIIRMGELASPSVPYEVVDFSIRRFFSYMEIKQYVRVDREVLFLRGMEKEICGIIQDVL